MTIYRYVLIITTFLMQWSLVPSYHVLHTGRFPHVSWHLGAKIISCFLISACVPPH